MSLIWHKTSLWLTPITAIAVKSTVNHTAFYESYYREPRRPAFLLNASNRIYNKNDFVKESKNLAGYSSEINFVRPLK